MEQAKCLNIWREHTILCVNNNHDHDCVYHLPTTTTTTMKRFNQQSISPSWEDYQEEEAFAHDTIRGTQEGSILWPPRSYSCSFCKREFRSAQALGGHMNVHRRDRALLKQAINTHDDHDHDHDHSHHNHDHQNHHDHVIISPSSQSMMLPQNPSQVCNPKTNAAHHFISRVSSNDNSAKSGISKVITTTNDGIDQPKVSMGLDLAIGTCQKEEDHQDELSFKCKKFKRSNDEDYDVALFPFLEEIKCSSTIKDNRGLKVPEILSLGASKSMEDLDLELRLG